MIGFAQGWNVELEVPEEEAERRGTSRSPADPRPQPPSLAPFAAVVERRHGGLK